MSSPSSLDVLSPVWSIIEQYLGLAATVRVSATCHTLRNLIIDIESGKIKVSHFVTNIGYKNKIFIAQFILNASIKILYESLRRLDMAYHPFCDDGQLFSDKIYHTVCHIISNLGVARNLEELVVIDVVTLIDSENDEIYSTLGRNLLECTQLKKLSVVAKNRYYYSESLMRALASVIRNRACKFEELSFQFSDTPSKKTNDPDAARDLFNAIFGATSLKHIRVNISGVSGPLLNEFLDASYSHYYSSLGKTVMNSLESFSLVCRLIESSDYSVRKSISSFLSLLQKNNLNLKSLELCVPIGCWDADSIFALRQLLRGRSLMEKVKIRFHRYNDNHGKIAECILEFIETWDSRANYNISFSFSEIHGRLDEKSETVMKLGSYYDGRGEKCLRVFRNRWSFRSEGILFKMLRCS